MFNNRNGYRGPSTSARRSAQDLVPGVSHSFNASAWGERERVAPAPGRGAGAMVTRWLVSHDAADALAATHQVEAFVDLLKREHMGDEIIDVDLAVHVP